VKLRYLVSLAHITSQENARLPIDDSLAPKCTYCKATSHAKDERTGDIICTNCGVVLEKLLKESFFGSSSGQTSAAPTRESYELDKLLRSRAIEGGRTTKVHKQRLLAKAEREINALCRDDRLSSVAVQMFENYSNSIETVRNFDKVVEACVACARKKVTMSSIGPDCIRPPQFSCDYCPVTFNCRKDQRLHRCKMKVVMTRKRETVAVEEPKPGSVISSSDASTDCGQTEVSSPRPLETCEHPSTHDAEEETNKKRKREEGDPLLAVARIAKALPAQALDSTVSEKARVSQPTKKKKKKKITRRNR